MPCATAAIGAPTKVDAVATSTAVTIALAPNKHKLMVSLCFVTTQHPYRKLLVNKA